MKAPTALAALLLLTVALAGCHDAGTTDDDDGTVGDDGTGDDGGDTPPASVTLTERDAPATVTAGEPFQITVAVEASRAVTSEHSGFHWGLNSSATADPSEYTQFLDMASPHVTEETTYPGTYTIPEWTLGEEYVDEVIFARAHSIIEGEHRWGDEFSFRVQAAA